MEISSQEPRPGSDRAEKFEIRAASGSKGSPPRSRRRSAARAGPPAAGAGRSRRTRSWPKESEEAGKNAKEIRGEKRGANKETPDHPPFWRIGKS